MAKANGLNVALKRAERAGSSTVCMVGALSTFICDLSALGSDFADRSLPAIANTVVKGLVARVSSGWPCA
jgi:hypothetical protein